LRLFRSHRNPQRFRGRDKSAPAHLPAFLIWARHGPSANLCSRYSAALQFDAFAPGVIHRTRRYGGGVAFTGNFDFIVRGKNIGHHLTFAGYADCGRCQKKLGIVDVQDSHLH
jgi:hypothetical protein